MAEVAVTAGGRTFRLEAGAPLHQALADAGLPVEAPCGGRGRCGRCRVRFVGAAPEPDAADGERLGPEELAAGFRLACRHRVAAGQQVEFPAAGLLVALPGAAAGAAAAPATDDAAARKALLAGTPRIDALAPFPLRPLVRKVFLRVPAAAGESGQARGDRERLLDALAAAGEAGMAAVPLAVLRDLPRLLRQPGPGVTAVVGEGRVLAVEPGDTAGRLFGAALDIGTTTLAVSLVDLATGAERAVVSGPNPQAVRGADLMARLGYAFTPEGRQELRERVLGGLNALLAEGCRREGIDPSDVYAAAVVGNTAMHHLFLGLEVEQLGLAPYVPATTGPLVLTAGEAGLRMNPAGLVYCLPLVGGFAGSDLAGVLLATRLWEREGPRLVLDLGTNGEILLGDREGLLACSAPAGPAFEGGAISSGMRAGPGAIQRVRLDGDVALDVIGGGVPAGLCGSGLVSAVAELLRAGLLDPSGRLRDGSFLLARAEEAAGGVPVVLTQQDVRQLQLAKGAVRAGAEVLLARRGLAPADLAEVLLAGTFGNYIGEEEALAIGLLPPVPAERVCPVGNAAAAGARLALASQEARAVLERVVRRVEHISLATLPEFQEVFLRSTFFPARGGGDRHGARGAGDR